MLSNSAVPCVVRYVRKASDVSAGRDGSRRRPGQRSSCKRRSCVSSRAEGDSIDELDAAVVEDGEVSATVADAASKSKARGAPKGGCR